MNVVRPHVEAMDRPPAQPAMRFDCLANDVPCSRIQSHRLAGEVALVAQQRRRSGTMSRAVQLGALGGATVVTVQPGAVRCPCEEIGKGRRHGGSVPPRLRLGLVQEPPRLRLGWSRKYPRACAWGLYRNPRACAWAGTDQPRRTLSCSSQRTSSPVQSRWSVKKPPPSWARTVGQMTWRSVAGSGSESMLARGTQTRRPSSIS